jgi:bacillithiol biosynthesis cysteine-adding enzyme BshC
LRSWNQPIVTFTPGFLDTARDALQKYRKVQSHTGLTAKAPTTGQGDAASSGRLPVDIRRFPWINRLASDYAFDYARLADFFAGDPGDPAAWRDAIARASRQRRQRDRLVELLQAQQQRRGAPPVALATTEVLRDSSSVAVVTGQQAGLFGGPLFTLLKALTALQLAERVRTEHNVPAVAIFWVDAEDHDWDEVKSCGVMDTENAPRSVALGDLPGAHAGPVARVKLNDSIGAALSELQSTLPATEFTPALIEDLRRCYEPGNGMADAFARWLERVLGSRGLIVFDASDPAAKPLVADVFTHEIEHAGETARLAAEAGAALAAHGYHAQVSPNEGSLSLFHMNAGREPIRIAPDGFQVGDGTQAKPALLDRARTNPAEFSPNVLLRPIVQDTLFPTVCYVAGPSELAYLGQLRRVYESFDVPMPLVQQRATATIVDSNAMRFLSRHDVRLESLRAQDEAALNELLIAQLPPSVEIAIQVAGDTIEERMDALAREVPRIDATLEGAARSTLSRMQDDLKKLHAKIVQAAKRKDETLRRQFHHARTQTFPAGHPQEREIGFVTFLNKYGPALVDRLLEALPAEMGTHWVITV